MHAIVSSPPIIFRVTFAAVSGEDRCVTTLITAAKETRHEGALQGENNITCNSSVLQR